MKNTKVYVRQVYTIPNRQRYSWYKMNLQGNLPRDITIRLTLKL